MISVDTILIVLVIIAGLYMAWNIGANDVANAMGTSVGSGALTLRNAVIIAAVLEFVGAFFFGSHVSKTVQSGIVDVSYFIEEPQLLVYGMLASLTAAGVWLQIASYYGWPVSTTHTIVGAVIGFGLVSGGVDAVHWNNISYIVASWVISPLSGGILSYLIFTFLRRTIFYAPNPVEASKKIAPLMIFCCIFVLALILLFSGLQNINLNFTEVESVLLSALIAGIGALIGWLFIRRIPSKGSAVKSNTKTDEAVLLGIEKARRHLQNTKASLKGKPSYRLSLILEEIDNLKHSLTKAEKLENTSFEYDTVERLFAYLQIMSACMMAFAHGANDVANAIGPLAAALDVLKTGVITPYATISPWILALGGAGIVVGLATWGWRVIETIGKKITELTPTRGFAAEFGAATTIVIASRLGMPVSTTHTLVGSVIGVGMARGIEALNLAMTRDIFISWLITVPAGAFGSIIFFNILKMIF